MHPIIEGFKWAGRRGTLSQIGSGGQGGGVICHRGCQVIREEGDTVIEGDRGAGRGGPCNRGDRGAGIGWTLS